MNIKILVAYHKQSVRLENNVYLPIQVNKDLSQMNLKMQGDNEGDNISKLNSIFCEMTAVYWAWKNLDADYVGLCHYRRIFSTQSTYSIKNLLLDLLNFIKGIRHENIFVKQFYYDNDDLFVADAHSFSEQLEHKIIRKGYDMVVPSPHKFYHYKVLNLFETRHIDNISMIKEIVKTKHPDFYPFLQKTLDGKRLFAANMFIMKKYIYDEYCNFVFDVLFSHISMSIEKKWCLDPYNEGCFARLSGYMAEVLTSAFIEKMISEGIRVKKVGTAFLGI